jgi:sortase A
MLTLIFRSLLLLFVLLTFMPKIEQGYYTIKAVTAQYLLQLAWKKSQQEPNKKYYPWPWADTSPLLKINFIQDEFIVLENASGESLAFAPGLVSQHILPGDKGNSLIAAHRDTHFKNLQDILLKQRIIVENKLGQRSVFLVDQIKIVNADHETPNIDLDHSRITLITCYPFSQSFSDSPLRYLVSAKLIEKPSRII